MYRTTAVVLVDPAPATTPVPVVRQSTLRRRVTLVTVAWAPLHLVVVAACYWGLGFDSPAFLFFTPLVALVCALHACAFRTYDESLLAPLPSTCRLVWAAALLVPVFGPLWYLLYVARWPEKHGLNEGARIPDATHLNGL